MSDYDNFDDIDDLLAGFESDSSVSDVAMNNAGDDGSVGNTPNKKSSHRVRNIIIGVIVALFVGLYAAVSTGMITLPGDSNSETDTATSDTPESDSTNAAPQPVAEQVQLINLEDVEFVSKVCTYHKDWGELSGVTPYSKQATEQQVRADMVKVLEQDINRVKFREKAIRDIPQEAHEKAVKKASNASINDVFLQPGDAPNEKVMTKASLFADAYKGLGDNMQQMRDALVKPATYDSYGLHTVISDVQKTMSSMDKEFRARVNEVFDYGSFSNNATLGYIVENSDCGDLFDTTIPDNIKADIEEQKTIHKRYVATLCRDFLASTNDIMGSDVSGNKKLCESNTAEPLGEYKDVATDGTPVVPESVKKYLTDTPSGDAPTPEDTVADTAADTAENSDNADREKTN